MIFIIYPIHANEWVQLNGKTTDGENITLLKSNIKSSTLLFSLDRFNKQEIETNNGIAWLINVENGVTILEKNAPGLPSFSTSLIIPELSKMKIRILSSKYKDFHDVLVAPSKGNLMRTINPESIPYEFGEVYLTDSFYPSEITELREPYIFRDFRGQSLLVKPMQYNPVTKTLRVYYEIKIEVYEDGMNMINSKVGGRKQMSSYQFIPVYSRHFLNFNNSQRYVPVEEYGNMLIISHADFIDEIQPFADWKIMSGTPVEIINVANIGGSSDIKQFISDYYHNNGLTYVLLVGDAQQVPSGITGGNDSDVDYSYIVGNDHYPDIFIGRFSSETEDHVTTQVERVLNYEQNPSVDTAWYTNSIGIASSEGPGDENEYDYEHIRNIGDNKLVPFTYDNAFEFYDGSQGGNDAEGNPTPVIISDAINSGASIINYAGHGSSISWVTSGFSNNDINNLSNTGKLPFIFSVACVNGDFVNNTCFAETWMRAQHNDEPSGAIATLMSTINQSWNPPMRGQDEMNDILTEAYSQNIKRTFGGICMNGCMDMNDNYGSDGYEITDTWTIFGDPSLEIRTAVPQELTVTYPSSLIVGSTSMSFTCNAEGAFATLSLDGEILGTAVIQNGEATITFDELSSPGTINFVITGFNYHAHICTIDIVPDDEAYIIYSGNSINDTAGNNNGLMDYSENILLTVRLTNTGTGDANGVTATLSTSSEYIEIINNEAFYGNITVGDTIEVIDAFAFNVANDIPDEIITNFTITASDENGVDIWESSFALTAHAPEMIFTGYTIDDSNGNDNGRIEPGETVDIIIETTNEGSSEAYNVITGISTSNQYITVNTDPLSLGNIPGGSSEEAVFSVTANGGTPDGTNVLFNVDILADHDISGSGDFFVTVGQKPILIINLSNSSSADSMKGCFSRLHVGIDETGTISDDIDEYKSLFILLGIYPSNYQLTDYEGNKLTDYLIGGGRIFMEGGDAWAFDPQTSVHELFHIVGIDDGSDDLIVIKGKDSGIMNGFLFEYDGNNDYIDRIEPGTGSELIFSNTSPYYGTGVSFENNLYKTIGTSFEFAGLVDQGQSTKDKVMAEILHFFDVAYIWTDIQGHEADNVRIKVFPNPVNTDATIQIQLDQNVEMSLSVHNLTGQTIITLVNQSKLSSGSHTYVWNTSNVAPGLYFYRLTTGKNTITNKIIVK